MLHSFAVDLVAVDCRNGKPLGWFFRGACADADVGPFCSRDIRRRLGPRAASSLPSTAALQLHSRAFARSTPRLSRDHRRRLSTSPRPRRTAALLPAQAIAHTYLAARPPTTGQPFTTSRRTSYGGTKLTRQPDLPTLLQAALRTPIQLSGRCAAPPEPARGAWACHA